MYKKGDVVKGLNSGAIYQCLEDEDTARGEVSVECIIASPHPGNNAQVGYKAQISVENLAPYNMAAASPAMQEKIEAESLVEQRRALRSFLGGM